MTPAMVDFCLTSDVDWVLYADVGYFWNSDVYGYDGVFPAFVEIALGRVPE